MHFIKPFSELTKNDAHIAGGKGASLGEMLVHNIPVPDGYVVTAKTFDYFIKETDLIQEIEAILGSVDHKTIHTVESASERIQDLIKNAQMPAGIKQEILTQFSTLQTTYVAVRSSATAEDGADHAWAGQLDSYLNTTETNLLEKVQHCWASLFTPRAIFYRFEKGLHATHISVAVVVQKMVNSEISGIAFSVHPVTEDRNQIIIEAGLGLGEAIVSGAVTPDSYIVTKKPKEIIDINVNTQSKALYRKDSGGNEWRDLSPDQADQQVLTQPQILELASIVETIENHYGFPCDIEWAFEQGAFYIVQSRPITTLGNQSEGDQVKKNPLIVDGIEWSLAVTRNMSFWHQELTQEGLFSYTKDFGIDAQLEQLSVTMHGTHTNAFIHQENYKKYAEAVMQKVSTKEGIEDLQKKYAQFAEELFESLEKCLKALTKETFSEFLTCYTRLTAGLMPTATIGRNGGELLSVKLAELGYEKTAIPDIMATITYPSKHTPLFDSQLDLLTIGAKIQGGISEEEKKELLNTWLKKYGCIPVNFCDQPWNQQVALEQLENALRKDCNEELLKAENNHKKRVEESEALLHTIDNQDVAVLAYALKEATTLNEFRKNVFCRISLGYRPLFQKIAEMGGSLKWEDCFFVRAREMLELLSGKNISIPTLVKERQTVSICRTKDIHNEILDSEIVERFALYIKSMQGARVSEEGASTVKGHSANKGKVQGIIKVILSSKDFHKLQPGEILVTTMTSVDFVPVMEKAAAFVTNEGGITSHASIVAREMNKPCIIGTKNATQLLNDGDVVEVDAYEGEVKILQRGLPRWEKVLQRNFPPFAWTGGAYYEWRGFKVGPMEWKRGREIQAKYKTVQSYIIQNPAAYYISNIKEVLSAIDNDFEKAIDDYNKEVFDAVRVNSANSMEGLNHLNELHKLMYVVMLIGFDVVIDIRALLDEYVTGPSEGFESFLATPSSPTAIQREQEAIRRGSPLSGQELERYVQDLVQDFSYLHQDYLGKPWNKDDYLQAIQNPSTLESYMSEEYNLNAHSDYIQWLITIFKKFLYMYEEGRNAMVRCAWIMKQTMEVLGYDPETLLYMTADEVGQFSKGQIPIISDELVTKRKEAFALYFEGDFYREYSGKEEVEQMLKEQDILHFWNEKIEFENELKGSIAFKGDITGKARLVFTQEDANNVEEGEVIISPMTQVEFLSGIRKCAAIVTDEGGIVCHAAIVSREFGKPCLLATGKATKIIKNGDMVQVDANNGILRILK